MAKKIKKVTLNTLANSIEELAQITARGFENTSADISGIKGDIQILQTDVSDVKLRLDNLTPRFEVKDLEKRVERLEEKAGIRR